MVYNKWDTIKHRANVIGFAGGALPLGDGRGQTLQSKALKGSEPRRVWVADVSEDRGRGSRHPEGRPEAEEREARE